MKITADKIIFTIGLTALICALAFWWFAPNGMLNQSPGMYGIIE